MTDEAAAKSSRGRTIGYWIATGLVAVGMGAGGVMDLLRPPDVVATFAHLGYPLYFAVMLGVWKILGTLVILAPGLRRVKEWAYAGIAIDLISAALSHAAMGDGAQAVVPPLVFLGLAILSHQLRPLSRRF